MIIVQGIELDLEQSSNDEYDWSLVFSPGSFTFPGISKQVESTIFHLKRSDYQCESFLPCLYSIYFNPKTNRYQIIPAGTEDECNDLGILIGGFQVKDCKMYFAAPKTCNDIAYHRSFTDEYNKAFAVTEYECQEDPNNQECIPEFNPDQFDEAFDTSCIVAECPGGGFGRLDFDDSFNNKDRTC
jgi:hypothetical protein